MLAEVAATRRVVDLGRQARAAPGLGTPAATQARRPGRSSRSEHADEIREELRVKEVEFGPVEATELRVKPNLPGARAEARQGARRGSGALEAGDFEQLPDGGFRVAGHDLAADEVLVETSRSARAGPSPRDDGVTVALDTALDPELELEGRAST